MANGWTLERRQRASAMIHQWQPWKHSTGPTTAEGKARASRNGWKGGTRPLLRSLARELREHARTLKRMPRSGSSSR